MDNAKLSSELFVIMLHGVTTAGKSTTAKRLKRVLGRESDLEIELVSTTDIKKRRGLGVLKRNEPKQSWAYREAISDLGKYLSRGKAVVLDATFAEREQRKQVYDRCVRHSARLCIVHCVCEDKAELRYRMDERLRRERQTGESRWDSLSEAEIKNRSTTIEKLEEIFADDFPQGLSIDLVVYDTFRNRLNSFRLGMGAVGRQVAEVLKVGRTPT